MPGLLGGGKQAAELLMDYASRMQRAKAMGFDTDRVLYHGTGSPEIEGGGFIPTMHDETVLHGTSVTPSVDEANVYADPRILELRGHEDSANIIPMYMRGKVAEYSDFYDQLDDAATHEGFAGTPEDFARQAGISAVDMSRALGGDELFVLDPSSLRSINAAFDPAKRDSPDLLAGIGGAAVLGGGLLGSGEAEAAQQPRGPSFGQRAYQAAGNAAGTLLQAPETAMRGWRGLLTLPQGIDKAAQQARTDTDDLNYQLGGQVTDAMTPLFGTKAAPMMGYGAYLLPSLLSPF